MGGALPRLAGVFAIRVAEGDVDAGEFFVLQNMADNVRAGEVRADRKFADAVRVLVRVAIRVELDRKSVV